MTYAFVAIDDQSFDPALPRRAAARLLLLDAANRVLLLRHDPPMQDGHWSGPGGGIEPGEEAEAALRREITEEVDLPFHLELREVGDWRHQFRYRSRQVVQHESLFASHLSEGTAAADVALGPLALADGIVEARWCDATEVDHLRDAWPDGLADWLRHQGTRPADAHGGVD